jgi:signal transduction histidine kinase
MNHALPILALELRRDHDLVQARGRARELAALLGFATQDQIRIATAVSEIARNALRYAGGGKVEFELGQERAESRLLMCVSDRGPGIANLDDVLAGRYASATGMGIGIAGAYRLMDSCDIATAPGQGTTVRMTKRLPAGAPSIDAERLNAIAARLAACDDVSSTEELQRQNGELIATLSLLRERQDELTRLARELEDTNRGVLALYAELDQQAEVLRRADAMKSRFLSNMSHEFRTPLASMRALARLLLSQADGWLTAEQRKQVGLIDAAAHDLSELVDDLLDLAKIEAGKVVVQAAPFEVDTLFSALRGMLKPLLASERVQLVFDEPQGLPTVLGDEPKIAQILRNFISNALKFTSAGEVRVAARLRPEDPALLELSVRDTGIGIAPEHLELIFEEFAQVEHHLQRHGTGLGLPLCRRLAELLGGRLQVTSQPGVGSCFSVVLPLHSPMPGAAAAAPPQPGRAAQATAAVTSGAL